MPWEVLGGNWFFRWGLTFLGGVSYFLLNYAIVMSQLLIHKSISHWSFKSIWYESGSVLTFLLKTKKLKLCHVVSFRCVFRTNSLLAFDHNYLKPIWYLFPFFFFFNLQNHFLSFDAMLVIVSSHIHPPCRHLRLGTFSKLLLIVFYTMFNLYVIKLLEWRFWH